jgi:lysophospholipase L1-like esterase
MIERFCRRRSVRLLCALPLLLLVVAAALGVVTVAVLGREVPDLGATSPTEDPAHPLLVAVGDSFMSGEGAPSYLLGTNSRTNRCHRARTAHPFLVAAAEGYRLVSVACSGAVTANLTEQQEQYDNGRQLDAVRRSDLHSAPAEVSVLLLGIGGNDAGFGEIVRSCLNEIDCAARQSGWLQRLDEVERRLQETFELVAAARAPETRVLVMTYPQPFALDATCVAGLSPAERDFVLQSFLPRLNQVIRFQGQRLGFEVVEVEDAFVGARVCETPTFEDSAMNVFTLANASGRPVSGGSVSGSFHPTPLGHQLLAERVLERLSGPRPADPPPGLPPAPTTGPPLPDILPPGSAVPFPPGTPCSGPGIRDEAVRALDDGQRRAELPGVAGSLLCYRDSYAAWQSVRVGSVGTVALDVDSVAQARVRYLEVLAQRPDGSWSRTLLLPPPEATPAEARFYASWLGRLLAVGALAVALAVAPWLGCAVARRRAREVPGGT